VMPATVTLALLLILVIVRLLTIKSIASCEGNTPGRGRFDVQNPVETGF
jgi:hypothetical protein